MTDQTPFERELADRLRSRADRTRVDLEHERIVGARRPCRTSARPTWALAATFAAVIALVVTGLVLLVRTADDPAPADTFPPVPTVPPPPDYGVLDDTEGPTINDHWHMAYGFSLCGQWVQLQGNLEEQDAQGQFVNEAFRSNGIHSHDDGVIHFHPFTSAATGERATLGLFLSNYGVELRDDGFAAPPGQLDDVWCGTADKELVVVVWPDATDPTDKVLVTDGLAATPLRDGAAITIALTDDPDGVPPPPWAADLQALATVDSAQLAPNDLLVMPATSMPALSLPPARPIVDVAECGQPVTGPASDLGIETVRIDVAPDRSSFELTLRNTTSDPIPVGVAPFLATLDADGAVASRPSHVGVWKTQVVSPGEALTMPVEEAVAGAWVLGLVACPDTSLATGEHQFVAVLDVGGAFVASDPITLAVTDGAAVVSSSVPTSTP